MTKKQTVFSELQQAVEFKNNKLKPILKDNDTSDSDVYDLQDSINNLSDQFSEMIATHKSATDALDFRMKTLENKINLDFVKDRVVSPAKNDEEIEIECETDITFLQSQSKNSLEYSSALY